MNLLILSPDYSRRTNWGHQHVRDALLRRVENSMQVGVGCRHNGELYLPKICEEMKALMGHPDAVLMENWKNYRNYSGVNEIDCLKAFVVSDYYPDARNNIVHYNEVLNKYEIDLAICGTPAVVRHIEKEKANKRLPKNLRTVWVSQGVDIDIFKRRPLEKIYDVMAVFGLVSYVYPNRPNVQELIRNMDIKSLIGDWKSNIRHHDYARAINQSKIFVNVNGVNNQVLMKYFESMASGTLLLTNRPEDCESYGFRPGKHFAVWHTLSDLQERIWYYLTHDEVREEIAMEGMNLVRREYSTDVIATEIQQELDTSLESNEN